jgi:hypothetical protein
MRRSQFMRIGREKGGDMSATDDKAVNHIRQYADEVLCAGWNPLAMQVTEPAARPHVSAVEGGDAEGFLARLYRCQQA